MHNVQDTRVEESADGTLKLAFLVDGHWTYVERFPAAQSTKLIAQLDEVSNAARRRVLVGQLH